MYCPTCGKDNIPDLKYCASCGTNLEAVSQALTGREEDFLTRLDTGMDQFIARYSEHVFRDAHKGAGEQKVSRSWRLLGQGVVTSLADFLLFILMWNFLPLRALILVFTTPFRLLSERSREQSSEGGRLSEGYAPPDLRERKRSEFLPSPVPSVTEETTTNLGAKSDAVRDEAPVTDKLD